MKKVTLNSLLLGVQHLCNDGTTLCSSVNGLQVLWTLRNPHGSVTRNLKTASHIEWHYREPSATIRRLEVSAKARLDIVAVNFALPVLAELANGSR